MSSLRNLRNPIPELVVQVSDGEGFPVRGVSPAMLLGLYNRHAGQLSNLFERLAERYRTAGNFEAEDAQAVVLGLLNDAPIIMAEIVALATGSDPADSANWELDLEIASKLPFPVQVDALMKIGQLTFTSDMPPGKLMALVVGAINSQSGKISAT